MRRWPWWGVVTLGFSALVSVLAVVPIELAQQSARPSVSAHARVHRMDAIAAEPEPVRPARPRRRPVSVGAELERQRALLASAVVVLLRGEHPGALRR